MKRLTLLAVATFALVLAAVVRSQAQMPPGPPGQATPAPIMTPPGSSPIPGTTPVPNPNPVPSPSTSPSP